MEAIKWERELGNVITPDLVAQHVDQRALRTVVGDVVDSDGFAAALANKLTEGDNATFLAAGALDNKELVESIRVAVVNHIDSEIVKSDRFRALVDSQLDSHRDKIRKLAARNTIDAKDEQTLRTELKRFWLKGEPSKLRSKSSSLAVYPFQDTLCFRASMQWNSQVEKPYAIGNFGISNVAASKLSNDVDRLLGRKSADWEYMRIERSNN